MISTKKKWITIGTLFGICLVFIFLGAFAVPKQSAFVYEYAEQLKNREIGGVVTKMPKNSVNIFLRGYFGVDFGKYTEFDDFLTTKAALDNHRVSAIWVSDVTADYLCKKGNYRALRPASAPGLGEERLEFGFVFRSVDTALKDRANEMLAKFEDNGITQKLFNYFVNDGKSDALCGLSGKGRVLRVGVTGAVPPLEMVDERGNVSGVAVELSKYLAAYLDMKVKFVVVDNDTAFSQLMAGKVDMLACYGTSENHSTEFPDYLMSNGYCSMKDYCLLVNVEK
ncbi:MAG: transporter substrate-binding domain-containing protein [Lachnospiraceae bacterium]|nr:transporter substrate-binding domain-containing protein [Lachnospiraceae bacterium]